MKQILAVLVLTLGMSLSVTGLGGEVSVDEMLKLMDQVDQSDQAALSGHLIKADSCSRQWQFACAREALQAAERYARRANEREMLAQSRSLLEREIGRERGQREEEARRAAALRSTVDSSSTSAASSSGSGNGGLPEGSGSLIVRVKPKGFWGVIDDIDVRIEGRTRYWNDSDRGGIQGAVQFYVTYDVYDIDISVSEHSGNDRYGYSLNLSNIRHTCRVTEIYISPRSGTVDSTCSN